MKKINVLGIVLLLLQGVAIADHAELQGLSSQLYNSASTLERVGRDVIGYYPTYRQRYAFEHLQFLRRTSYQFYQLTHRITNDHEHDMEIRRVYDRLEHDVHYARLTLHDLFYRHHTNDHRQWEIERLMSNCEYLSREIYHHLP